ncbi:MAG: energy-coupled thiamine transporter ThiT [Eubacteriales bacterium]|nr:energy-coupled thiamine transporter ThiT [Christensenellaceae bacterium]MDY5718665.1 energy-coupled thiamine transporter ThiT [Eubacteriales bacterium]
MEFVLLKKLAKLEGTELWMFIGAIVAVAALIAVLAVLNKKHVNAAPTVEKKGNKLTTRTLVQGALCIALAFALSYIKLFSMPMGGSITLFSMLPIFVFAWMYGPAAGLLAGFAYSLLQVVQGAYVVHPVQFVLDYFLSFTVLGLAGFFPKSLALGAGVGGFCRMLCGVLSGAIFFADSAAEAGYANAWAYSFMYNFTTIGVDTILCVIAALIPAVSKAAVRIRDGK